MSGLVLSLFPGIDLLGMAFEEEGFTVVRGPDVIWGGDIRKFHPPTGRFDGVIGGPPCQEFTGFANLVKIKTGKRSTFGNLIPEFERVVAAAAPQWWVMENVPAAPAAAGALEDFVVSNRDLGEIQHRERRFCIGGLRIQRHMPPPSAPSTEREPPVTGAHTCSRRPKGGHGENRTLGRMLELQGLPADFFGYSPLTVLGKRKLIGNGVPMAMGRAIAKAVKAAMVARP